MQVRESVRVCVCLGVCVGVGVCVVVFNGPSADGVWRGGSVHTSAQ